MTKLLSVTTENKLRGDKLVSSSDLRLTIKQEITLVCSQTKPWNMIDVHNVNTKIYCSFLTNQALKTKFVYGEQVSHHIQYLQILVLRGVTLHRREQCNEMSLWFS